VPALRHTLRLDPKIAAGPIPLALADIGTLLFYFSSPPHCYDVNAQITS
jgi:magnesium transporter